MKNIQQHLSKIEDDQVINGIDTIEDTQRNDAGRHYAVSQMVQPVLVQGYYNEATGRYVLGARKHPTTRTIVSSLLNTPTVAIVVPAGRVYRVIAVTGSNDITAPAWSMVFAPSVGPAATLLNSGAFTLGGVNVACLLMGLSVNGSAAIGHGCNMSELWMRAGDSLTVDNTNDVAGDTITIAFVFEVYEEGV